MSTTIGIDLASVDAVAESIAQHAERYLTRIYTQDELAACRDARGAPVAERLAARFAAKEALLKILRCEDEPIPWRAISVRTNRFGAPSFELTGPAQDAARRRRLRSVALSLTHEGPFAAAVVSAQVQEGH